MARGGDDGIILANLGDFGLFVYRLYQGVYSVAFKCTDGQGGVGQGQVGGLLFVSFVDYDNKLLAFASSGDVLHFVV